MWFFIISALILSAIGAWFKSPSGKGWRGEFRVKRALGKTIPGLKYIINDLTLTDKNGKSSQIDHLLINQSGILVVETKNYSGRIYGNEKQREWTQVLAYGRYKNSFYNPVRQNATHLYRLAEIVGKDIPLYSAIVFVQNNISYISAPHVYNIVGLEGLIRQPGTAYLTIDEQERIYEQLMAIKEGREVSKKQHVANIKNMQQQLASNICPRCGANLVERNGKYGIFWGCSNYPNCKFTKR